MFKFVSFLILLLLKPLIHCHFPLYHDSPTMVYKQSRKKFKPETVDKEDAKKLTTGLS